LTDTAKIWRYMSLAKFISLLDKKQLWLSRSDTLGDNWELTLAGKQLERVIQRHPIDHVGNKNSNESAINRTQRIIKNWRNTTFVNCWSLDENESHALWQLYCGLNEGVSIQTTLPHLNYLLITNTKLSLERVVYQPAGMLEKTPSIQNLITSKRPMFAFEKEIRLYLTVDKNLDNLPGVALPWIPSEHIEAIYIHPDASLFFKGVVEDFVKQFAPSLFAKIHWSSMRETPPT
jgi:hypothetical protein